MKLVHLPIHSDGGKESHSASSSLIFLIQVVFDGLLFGNRYPSSQEKVQILPNIFDFVQNTSPFVGAIIEVSHLITEKKFYK